MSPHADHEIHRDEREFPENKEEKKIERDEDADHGRFDDEESDEKALDVFLDGLPGAQNRERREKSGQQNEKQADAIDAQMVINRLSRSNREFLELIAAVPE